VTGATCAGAGSSLAGPMARGDGLCVRLAPAERRCGSGLEAGTARGSVRGRNAVDDAHLVAGTRELAA